LITGSTLTALQADIRAINQMFERARMRQAGKTLVRTFIKFQASGEATTWLSEIYDGRVVMPEGALAGDWANTQLEVAVIWERAPFWEGDTWVAVPLTNGNGTDKTDGINVYNCCDGSGNSPNKRHNYVDIDGINDIAGELPAPVKLTFAVPAEVKNIYLGLQATLSGLSLVSPVAEAEDFTFHHTYGTATNDANCSAGKYLSYHHLDTLVNHRSSIYKLMDLSNYSGSAYRFFVRWRTAPSVGVLKSQFSVKDAILEFLSTQYVFSSGKKLEQIGDLFLPPGRMMMPDSGTLKNFMVTFAIYSLLELTVEPDFFFWMPLDSFIQIGGDRMFWTSADPSNPVLIYAEGLDRKIYATNLAGSDLQAIFDRVYGGGLYLYPGVTQRLNFLFGDDAALTVYTSVKAWYKPRRITL